MADLKNHKLIYLKGILFLLIIVLCAASLLIQSFTIQTTILIGLLIWSSARLYYFIFYVIEHYVDNRYRFVGILSFIKYVVRGSQVEHHKLDETTSPDSNSDT